MDLEMPIFGAQEQSYNQPDFGVILYVPFLSLHHVMTSFTSCSNVGWFIKGSVVHRNRQQCLAANKWLGLSVTVRVRVRARVCIFSLVC